MINTTLVGKQLRVNADGNFLAWNAAWCHITFGLDIDGDEAVFVKNASINISTTMPNPYPIKFSLCEVNGVAASTKLAIADAFSNILA